MASRVAGLPVSLACLARQRESGTAARLRHLYARRYWRIREPIEALELGLGLLAAPFLVAGSALWHAATSGRGFADRRPRILQLADQLRLYAAAGVMPGAYYVFGLYDEPTPARARAVLKRFETKGIVYSLVRERSPPRSSLDDKAEFAERCHAAGLPAVPTIAVAAKGSLERAAPLPDQDLFVKPLSGKGGRGAERWLSLGGQRFVSSRGEELDAAQLAGRLAFQSRRIALIVQPRIVNHASLEALNAGALATVRALTFFDADRQPRLAGAVLRMASSTASVVDNFHRGGIAAAIDPATGELGPATDLGKDARVGWLDEHPVTGARIAGERLAWWPEMLALALEAQRVFADRVFVGWDIAMTPDGPLLIEGNGSPDLDILQRCARRGMAESAFAEALAEWLGPPAQEAPRAAAEPAC